MCKPWQGVQFIKNMVSRVPQGSVVGPTLFLIYVIFLTEGIISNFGMFVDDFNIQLNI